MAESLFPPEALPSLIDVMQTFNATLRQHIQFYDEQESIDALKKVLPVLRKDLKNYVAQFDGLHQNAETTQEYLYLQDFAKYLGHGQRLVKRAEEILQMYEKRGRSE